MIKATYRDGRFIPDEPVDLPEGHPVVVEPLTVQHQRICIDESECSDTPESLAAWDAWIRQIEPLEYTPEEEVAFARSDEQMRQFNREGVRRQMEAENP